MATDLLPVMELPVVPLRTMVLFPHAALPMTLTRPAASEAIEAALKFARLKNPGRSKVVALEEGRVAADEPVAAWLARVEVRGRSGRTQSAPQEVYA